MVFQLFLMSLESSKEDSSNNFIKFSSSSNFQFNIVAKFDILLFSNIPESFAAFDISHFLNGSIFDIAVSQNIFLKNVPFETSQFSKGSIFFKNEHELNIPPNFSLFETFQFYKGPKSDISVWHKKQEKIIPDDPFQFSNEFIFFKFLHLKGI